MRHSKFFLDSSLKNHLRGAERGYFEKARRAKLDSEKHQIRAHRDWVEDVIYIFATKMHVTTTQAIMLLSSGDLTKGKAMHRREMLKLPTHIVNPITLAREQNPHRQRLQELADMPDGDYVKRARDIFINACDIRHPLKIVHAPKNDDFEPLKKDKRDSGSAVVAAIAIAVSAKQRSKPQNGI